MDLKSFAEVYWSMQEGKVNPGLQAYLDKKKGKKDNGEEKEEENGKESKGSKPDFLDLDKDGDKKEPMKKAAKEKKMKEEAVIEHHQKDAEGKVIEHEVRLQDQELYKAYADATPSSVEEEKTVLEQLSENGEELDMFDAVVAYLIDEGFTESWEDAQKIMITLKPELVEEVYQSQLIESEKLASKAYERAQTLGARRRSSYEYRKKGSFGPGKNERAGYNLSQSQQSRNASLATQGGNQTGGGAKSFGFARDKSNPIKSRSMGDSGAIGHRKKRDEKVTMKKDGKTPLKTPRYKMSAKKRMDHHSSTRYQMRDPKQNPKHEANKKK